ncbi:MAG: hypothetical protein QXU92_02755 [Candidatus Diapherotrites archaeon]
MLSWFDFLNIFLGRKKIDSSHFSFDLKSSLIPFAKSFFPGVLLFSFEVFIVYLIFLAFSEPFVSLLKKGLLGLFVIVVLVFLFFVIEFLFYYVWALLHYFVGNFFCKSYVSREKFVLSSLYLFSCVNFVKKLLLAIPVIGWLLCPFVSIYSVYLYQGFIQRFFGTTNVKTWIIIIFMLVVLFTFLLVLSLVCLLLVFSLKLSWLKIL